VEDVASRFMEWWAQPAGKEEAPAAGACGGSGEDADLRLCSQVRCEWRETRPHEFRRARCVALPSTSHARARLLVQALPLVRCWLRHWGALTWLRRIQVIDSIILMASTSM
jgi:hypothetical protein